MRDNSKGDGANSEDAMNRRSALILFSVGMLGAGAAHAGGFVDDILAQLKR